jgi:putative lipoprotein
VTLRRTAALLSIVVLGACAGPKPPGPAPAPEAPTPAPSPPVVPTIVPAPPPPPAVPPPSAFLTGTVSYRQRLALTPQAEVQVELRDVSAQDAGSVLIAKQVIATPGQVPIPFSLEYDPTKIRGGRTYAISARIVDRGQLQFLTDTRIPVLTGGAQGPIEILVVPVR